MYDKHFIYKMAKKAIQSAFALAISKRKHFVFL